MAAKIKLSQPIKDKIFFKIENYNIGLKMSISCEMDMNGIASPEHGTNMWNINRKHEYGTRLYTMEVGQKELKKELKSQNTSSDHVKMHKKYK